MALFGLVSPHVADLPFVGQSLVRDLSSNDKVDTKGPAVWLTGAGTQMKPSSN
jgi:hypothetical protein